MSGRAIGQEPGESLPEDFKRAGHAIAGQQVVQRLRRGQRDLAVWRVLQSLAEGKTQVQALATGWAVVHRPVQADDQHQASLRCKARGPAGYDIRYDCVRVHESTAASLLPLS